MYLLVCSTAAHHHADLDVISNVPRIFISIREVTASLEVGRNSNGFPFTRAAVCIATGDCIAIIIIDV